MSEQMNFKRDRAIVTPAYHGACWKQDGRYYDQDGARVRVPGEAADAAPSTAVARADTPRAKTNRARKGRGEAAVPDAQKGGPKEAVDLRAWALGQAKYRFGLVAQAMREKHDTVPSGERGAIDALIANNVVTLDEAAKARPGMGLKD